MVRHLPKIEKGHHSRLKIIKVFSMLKKQRYFLVEEMTIFCFADPTEAEQRSSRVASEWSEIKT